MCAVILKQEGLEMLGTFLVLVWFKSMKMYRNYQAQHQK